MKTKELVKGMIIRPLLAVNLVTLGAFFLYVTYYILQKPMTDGHVFVKLIIAVCMLFNSVAMFVFIGEVTKLIGKYALDSFKDMAKLPIEKMSRGAKYVRNVVVATLISWVLIILLFEKVIITDYPMWVFVVYNVIFVINILLAFYANHIVKYKVN